MLQVILVVDNHIQVMSVFINIMEQILGLSKGEIFMVNQVMIIVGFQSH